MRKDFSTMVELLSYLKEEGFSANYNLLQNSLECKEQGVVLSPEMFEVVDFFRFEGESNPDDSSIVYAIESKTGLKGVVVNAYGAYSDPLSDEMVSKLTIQRDGD